MTKEPKQQTAAKTDKRQSFLQRKPKSAADRPFISPHHTSAIQPKLTINQPGDAYEQEADRMADHVMRMPLKNAAPPMISRIHAGAPVQRMCSACAESGSTCSDCAEASKEPEIHRKPENADPAHAPDAVTQRLSQRKGRGNTLPPALQEQMGKAFQSDLSNVRVHTDSEATAMSRDLNAQAFTYGQDIYFNAGKYEPGTAEGRGLLGHELTHTVQQGGDVIQRLITLPDATHLDLTELTSAFIDHNKTASLNAIKKLNAKMKDLALGDKWLKIIALRGGDDFGDESVYELMQAFLENGYRNLYGCLNWMLFELDLKDEKEKKWQWITSLIDMHPFPERTGLLFSPIHRDYFASTIDIGDESMYRLMLAFSTGGYQNLIGFLDWMTYEGTKLEYVKEILRISTPEERIKITEEEVLLKKLEKALVIDKESLISLILSYNKADWLNLKAKESLLQQISGVQKWVETTVGGIAGGADKKVLEDYVATNKTAASEVNALGKEIWRQKKLLMSYNQLWDEYVPPVGMPSPWLYGDTTNVSEEYIKKKFDRTFLLSKGFPVEFPDFLELLNSLGFAREATEDEIIAHIYQYTHEYQALDYGYKVLRDRGEYSFIGSHSTPSEVWTGKEYSEEEVLQIGYANIIYDEQQREIAKISLDLERNMEESRFADPEAKAVLDLGSTNPAYNFRALRFLIERLFNEISLGVQQNQAILKNHLHRFPLLRMYVTNPLALPHLLGSSLPQNSWSRQIIDFDINFDEIIITDNISAENIPVNYSKLQTDVKSLEANIESTRDFAGFKAPLLDIYDEFHLEDSDSNPITAVAGGRTRTSANASAGLNSIELKLENTDPSQRKAALDELLMQNNEESWQALLMTYDSPHEDVRSKAQQTIKTRLKKDATFKKYVVNLVNTPQGLLSDFAFNLLTLYNSTEEINEDHYRKIVLQNLHQANDLVGIFVSKVQLYFEYLHRNDAIDFQIDTTWINEGITNIEETYFHDLGSLGIRTTNFIEQLSIGLESIESMQEFIPTEISQRGKLKVEIHPQLINLITLSSKLGGEDAHEHFQSILTSLQAWPGKFAQAFSEDLYSTFTRVKAKLQSSLNSKALSSFKSAWATFKTDMITPLLTDTDVIILKLEQLKLTASSAPNKFFAELDTLSYQIESITEKAQYALSATDLMDTYSEFAWRNEVFKDEYLEEEQTIKNAWGLIALAAYNRDTDPEGARRQFNQVIESEVLKDVDEKIAELYKFQQGELDTFMDIMILLVSIKTGGLAGGAARTGLGFLTRAGASTFARQATVAIATLGAEATAFHLTSRSLKTLANRGDFMDDTFWEDYLETFLMFGAMKGGGALFQKFLAPKAAKFMQSTKFPNLAKATSFLGKQATVFSFFQAWTIGAHWIKTGEFISPTDKEFWQIAAQNAFFLGAIQFGMAATRPLVMPKQSQVPKEWLETNNAEGGMLSRQMAAWKSNKQASNAEAMEIMKQAKSILERRLGIFERIHANYPAELSKVEIIKIRSEINSLISSINNTLAFGNAKVKPSATHPGTYYYEGSFNQVAPSLREQGFVVAESTVPGQVNVVNSLTGEASTFLSLPSGSNPIPAGGISVAERLNQLKAEGKSGGPRKQAIVENPDAYYFDLARKGGKGEYRLRPGLPKSPSSPGQIKFRTAKTALPRNLNEPLALYHLSRSVHNVAPKSMTTQGNITIEQSTVSIVKVKLADGTMTFYASGNNAYLTPNQRVLLKLAGVPEKNILSGEEFRVNDKLENHAEKVILRNLPAGAVDLEWGISWAGGQKAASCSHCATVVDQTKIQRHRP
ncbi:MAG TPA: DUF4157 domain-containing protein [Haliscomenobacter sp.]|uniref:eCIS core domain-containing protein n=1 Tax=Haliscomenobacter sp. TaxID=2717303 RepID=UPI002B6E248C|nr:DUF4157 domain-containing protein [Haliscomenobacter sp.]HOY16497.1 DUF4157 domain-containing protein [Haliscomenobacter sp.]